MTRPTSPLRFPQTLTRLSHSASKLRVLVVLLTVLQLKGKKRFSLINAPLLNKRLTLLNASRSWTPHIYLTPPLSYPLALSYDAYNFNRRFWLLLDHVRFSNWAIDCIAIYWLHSAVWPSRSSSYLPSFPKTSHSVLQDFFSWFVVHFSCEKD